MNEPLLHARTRLQIEAFLKNPAHGLLITGVEGVGKYFIAKWLASQLSEETITLLPPEDKTVITIEQIRELYAITKTGSSLTVIIKDAQLMRTEAQNAFLKLLEEPPKNTHFILTVDSSKMLLKTIASRCQKIEVAPPLKSEILSYSQSLQTVLSPEDQKAYLHSSKGLPGTFFELLANDDSATAHSTLLKEAKQFYSGNQYQRYQICAQHTYQKQWALELLPIISIIVETLLRQNSTKATQQKLVAQAELLQNVTQAIESESANVKIQLTKLAELL